MSVKELKHQLYQLMAASLSIQSLSSEERLKMQDKILSLPEGDMEQMLHIFQDEQAELKELHRRAKIDQKQAKKVDSLVDSLRDAGHILDKAFLTARESDERDESSKISSDLLKQIDLIQ